MRHNGSLLAFSSHRHFTSLAFVLQPLANGIPYSQQTAVQSYNHVPTQLQPVITTDTTQQVQLQQQQQQQQQQQVVVPVSTATSQSEETGQKRLHVTNIPFRFRDNDLKQMFGVRFSGFQRVLMTYRGLFI